MPTTARSAAAHDPMTPPVSGRVAVITGASRGLGAGLAHHFAGAGMHLGLCARHLPALVTPTSAAPRQGHGHGNGHGHGIGTAAEAPVCEVVDVTDRVALEHFAATVVATFGRIDLWVNNAGLLGPIGPLAEADPAAVVRVMDVNANGVLHGSAVFAAHVRTRPGPGVLVNVSTGAATRPYYGWAAYGASKAAVDQLTRVVALEEGVNGLAAYALSPGLIDTDMQVAIRDSDERAFPDGSRFRRAAADHRFNTPSWVGDFVLELAFGAEPKPGVVVRVPDQPVSGSSG